MNELINIEHAVYVQNDLIKTNSLKVAEYFGKHHKNVLQRLESLECSPEFNELNFQPVEYTDAKGESRPMYEMTKDGFIFLVMGFTGAKAAQIKEAYIQAFNHMATQLQNQHICGDDLKTGAIVQLVSGGPQLSVSQLLTNKQGIIETAEVLWFHQHKLQKEIVPIACLCPLGASPVLQNIWSLIYDYGIDQLNHSAKPNTIALNLSQLLACIPALPPKKQLMQQLKTSTAPFPQCIDHSIAVRSTIDRSLYRCFIFQSSSKPHSALLM
ncbi:Rha family transcriptional regulator [Acinetobacter tandoii]|uniref:Rha family transcriptional regulator n=1 Tax=Acinetobacter tandoii TaxID=202954 RepID=UPI0040463FC4